MKKIVFFLTILFVWSVTANALDGPIRGMNPVLLKNLKKLERRFGKVYLTPHGGCRNKAHRSAPNSYHLIRRGCRAADIYINGVSRQAILNWWGRNVGGGRGFYCGRRFVHVDVGPKRTWRWFCGKRKYYASKKSRKRKKYKKSG